MRNKFLCIELIISFIIFEMSWILFWWAMWIIIPTTCNNGITEAEWVPIFSISIMIFGGIGYLITLFAIYNDTCLEKDQTRKIYKANKQLKKLKLKKRYLETKKSNETQATQLKRQICCLKQEIENGYSAICQDCGKKIPPYACFCPHCGVIIKEVRE